jgi:NACalpha-BTF3-like transcription factor
LGDPEEREVKGGKAAELDEKQEKNAAGREADATAAEKNRRKTTETDSASSDDVDIGAEGGGVSVNKAKQGVKRPQADSATK